MKLTKKLIPAIGMLMLSAVMLVTSSFAWFSMNTEVSATNMTITAKGDQVYLQIVRDDQEFVAGSAQTTVAATDNSGNVYVPTNVYNGIDADGKVTPFNGTANTLVWVTATSNDPAFSDNKDHAGIDKYTKVETSALTKYVYQTNYKLRLDPDAGNVAGGKLKVTGVAFEGTAPSDALSTCVSVLIVCDDNAILYKQAVAGNFSAVSGSKATLTTEGFPANGVNKTVSVYVFFDGDNQNCTTKNVTNTPYTVSVTFNVDAD
jgi:hypothetical protein